MTRRPALALAAVALALLPACGGEGALPAETGTAPTTTSTTAAPPATTSTTAPAGGLRASIDVNRLFVLEHAMGLGLQNLDDVTRTVVQIQIESNLFETVPLADERVILTPGLRELVMPVPYGAPVCDDPDAVAAFTAVVRFDDGTEVRVPAPPRSDGTMERTHARECAAVALLERVAIGFGDEWTPEGFAIHGELTLTERSDGPPVALSQLAGSVIFTASPEAPVDDLAVTDDEPEAALPITIDAARCDPHGLSEAKRAFVFVAWLSVDGAESVAVDLPLDGPVRTALDAVLADCLAAGGIEAQPPG